MRTESRPRPGHPFRAATFAKPFLWAATPPRRVASSAQLPALHRSRQRKAAVTVLRLVGPLLPLPDAGESGARARLTSQPSAVATSLWQSEKSTGRASAKPLSRPVQHRAEHNSTPDVPALTRSAAVRAAREHLTPGRVTVRNSRFRGVENRSFARGAQPAASKDGFTAVRKIGLQSRSGASVALDRAPCADPSAPGAL